MLQGWRTLVVMGLGFAAAWLQHKGIVFPASDQAATATTIMAVVGIVMRLLTKGPVGVKTDANGDPLS